MQTDKKFDKNDLIKDWVEQCDSSNTLDDDDIESLSSIAGASSIATDSNITDISSDFERIDLDSGNIINNNIGNNITNLNLCQNYQSIVNNTQTSKNVENFTITDCKNVHIGDRIYVSGPLYVQSTENLQVKLNKSLDQNLSDESAYGEEVDDQSERQRVLASAFMPEPALGMDENVLRIVERRAWIAQPPMNPLAKLEKPVPYVIISHTASETGLKQSEMVFLVRHIQCFHIESRNWDDIAYNFLIGGDHQVYEGRGWDHVGAHTYGFNKKAIGISFVGTFMNMLPSRASLNTCKLLIQQGIELGHIDQNYKLLAHCQCSKTQSPGKMLYEELQKWDRWSATP